LERLRLNFRCAAPDVDETRLFEEAPADMAGRLALAKASNIAKLHPDALVIGSDQVASVAGRIIGKPGNFAMAKSQLQRSSGLKASFYTGVAVVCLARNLEQFHVEPFCVHFRTLSDVQIEEYLRLDEPYDCAGSFKAEGLGIALFEQMSGSDPTSLEGLPLIKLTELLRLAGIDVLLSQAVGRTTITPSKT
jgi:septum formation protein